MDLPKAIEFSFFPTMITLVWGWGGVQGGGTPPPTVYGHFNTSKGGGGSPLPSSTGLPGPCHTSHFHNPRDMPHAACNLPQRPVTGVVSAPVYRDPSYPLEGQYAVGPFGDGSVQLCAARLSEWQSALGTESPAKTSTKCA